ncbi:MAG: carbon-nitrogen hydrolase family protein [Sedimentibacter sp.]
MKLGMVQMSMKSNIEDNFNKSLDYCDKAKDAGCDLLFFPEVQLSPFFPQYEKKNVENYVVKEHDEKIRQIAAKAKKHNMCISPNIYLEKDGRRYDASLWINKKGEIEGISKMVHILQAEQFYEKDYYHPSEDGFRVYDTEFGRIGIVICFDRHLPESIRTCAAMGAELIIIPTANTKAEPLEMFEWEVRVQAMQNQVFIAMCNRIGLEGSMDFAGESLLVHPSGDLIYKAGDEETLIVQEIDLSEVSIWRKKRPYFQLRRPETYK